MEIRPTMGRRRILLCGRPAALWGLQALWGLRQAPGTYAVEPGEFHVQSTCATGHYPATCRTRAGEHQLLYRPYPACTAQIENRYESRYLNSPEIVAVDDSLVWPRLIRRRDLTLDVGHEPPMVGDSANFASSVETSSNFLYMSGTQNWDQDWPGALPLF